MRRSKVLVLDTELLMVEHSMCCGAIADSGAANQRPGQVYLAC